MDLSYFSFGSAFTALSQPVMSGLSVPECSGISQPEMAPVHQFGVGPAYHMGEVTPLHSPKVDPIYKAGPAERNYRSGIAQPIFGRAPVHQVQTQSIQTHTVTGQHVQNTTAATTGSQLDTRS